MFDQSAGPARDWFAAHIGQCLHDGGEADGEPIRDIAHIYNDLQQHDFEARNMNTQIGQRIVITKTEERLGLGGRRRVRTCRRGR
jgi:hypothetical protein